MRRFIALVGVVWLLLLGRSAVAETKVTVSDTHLCCGQCLKAVDATLKDMQGVTFKSDQGAKTIEIVASLPREPNGKIRKHLLRAERAFP